MNFKIGDKVRFLHGCISEAPSHCMEVKFFFGKVLVPEGTTGIVTGVNDELINVAFEPWEPKLAGKDLTARGFHLDCFELEQEYSKRQAQVLSKTVPNRMDLLII